MSTLVRKEKTESQANCCYSTPYKVDGMTITTSGGTRRDIKVVVDEAEGCNAVPAVTDVLIEYQERGQRSGATYAYYAKEFLNFLYREYGLKDLTKATAAQIEQFARWLKMKGKKAHTIRLYSFLLDKIFDQLYVRGCISPSSSLLILSKRLASIARQSDFEGHFTSVGAVMRLKTKRMRRDEPLPMKSYEKTYTAQEIQIILEELTTLRDKCIFLLMCETGYRLSSALSVTYDIEELQRNVVEETHSKTGKLHDSRIGDKTRTLIEKYIRGERTKAVKKAGFDCGMLFVALKGKNIGRPLNYDAYYQILQRAESRIHQKYPNMLEQGLYAHGCRATYLNALMDAAQSNGKNILDIMRNMDWKSLQSMDNYLNMQRATVFDEAGLFDEVFKRIGD